MLSVTGTGQNDDKSKTETTKTATHPKRRQRNRRHIQNDDTPKRRHFQNGDTPKRRHKNGGVPCRFGMSPFLLYPKRRHVKTATHQKWRHAKTATNPKRRLVKTATVQLDLQDAVLTCIQNCDRLSQNDDLFYLQPAFLNRRITGAYKHCEKYM